MISTNHTISPTPQQQEARTAVLAALGFGEDAADRARRAAAFGISGVGGGRIAGFREAVLCGSAGCITGDAEIIVNRAGKGFRLPLSEVVRRHNGGVAGGKTWRKDIETRVQGRGEDGGGYQHVIDAAYFSGRKQVYRVRTITGREVTASEDHPFFTRDGWVQLRDLRVGAEVCVLVPPSKTTTPVEKKRYLLTSVANHPFAGAYLRGEYNNRPEYLVRRVATHRLVAEATLSGMTLDAFLCRVRAGQLDGLVFLDPRVTHVHHLNGNHLDNRPENLIALSSKVHALSHVDATNVLWREAYETVCDISDAGVQDTYDLTIRDDHPCNFTANGFVVHNSGKTTTVGFIVRSLLELGADLMFMAPTWKAARRQEQVIKGIDVGLFATSIHRVLYGRPITQKPESGAELARDRLKFTLRANYDDVPEGCVWVVDEASMVGWKLAEDIRTVAKMRGVAILWVGDGAQLPPVNEGAGVNLSMATAALTEVHRQKGDSPILDLATWVREGGALSRWRWDATKKAELWYSTVELVGVVPAMVKRLGEDWNPEEPSVDFISLTYRNADRRYINAAVQKALVEAGRIKKASKGQGEPIINVGDRVVGTGNGAVMNGDLCRVVAVRPVSQGNLEGDVELRPEELWAEHKNTSLSYVRVKVVGPCGEAVLTLPGVATAGDKGDATYAAAYYTPRKLEKDEKKGLPKSVVLDSPLELGYCLTVHKAQGSGARSVFVLLNPDSTPDEYEYPKWLYTAVTRAERELKLVVVPGLPSGPRE